MTDVERIEQRLSAVERVVVDGDVSLEQLSELSALTEAVQRLEERLAEQEHRIATLEANVQSVEGYVGNVESVNDDVERHAAAAIATADRLERRIDALEVELDDLQGGILERDPAASDDDSTGADGSHGTSNSELAGESNAESTGRRIEASASSGPTETVFEFGASGQPPTNDQSPLSSGGVAEARPDDPTPERSVAELFESDVNAKTAGASEATADDADDASKNSPRSPSTTGAEHGDDPVTAADQRAVAASVGDSAGSTSSPDGASADSGLLGSIRSRLP